MRNYLISLFLVLLLFLATFYLDDLAFAILTSLIGILGLRELLKIRHKERKPPAEIELLSYLIVVFFIMNNFNGYHDFYLVDYRLLAALLLIDFIPLVIINDKRIYSLIDALYLIGCTLAIGTTFNLILQFRSYNVNYVTYIFMIAIVTDIFGFITGKFIGCHRLISISPKKTVEGFFGGLIMGTVLPAMFYTSTISTRLPIYGVFIITALLSFLGQVGDLVFSFIKREYNKKDFSNIIIGNGGVLDVFDSIIFVSLGFLLFLSVL